MPKKLKIFFSRRPQKPSKYTSNLSYPVKTVLKIDSCSLALAGGCTSCPGGALTHFPCKLGLKIFFTALGGAGAPTAPPATPMFKAINFGINRKPVCDFLLLLGDRRLETVYKCDTLCLDAGSTSESHHSTHDDDGRDGDDDIDNVDNVDDADDDDDDGDGGGGGDGDAAFTLDFNLGTIQRRRDIQTKLLAATLNLRKKLTRADNGKPNYFFIFILFTNDKGRLAPLIYI